MGYGVEERIGMWVKYLHVIIGGSHSTFIDEDSFQKTWVFYFQTCIYIYIYTRVIYTKIYMNIYIYTDTWQGSDIRAETSERISNFLSGHYLCVIISEIVASIYCSITPNEWKLLTFSTLMKSYIKLQG